MHLLSDRTAAHQQEEVLQGLGFRAQGLGFRGSCGVICLCMPEPNLCRVRAFEGCRHVRSPESTVRVKISPSLHGTHCAVHVRRIRISIYIYPSIKSINPSIHQSIPPSLHPSIPPSLPPSIHPSIHPSLHPIIYPCSSSVLCTQTCIHNHKVKPGLKPKPVNSLNPYNPRP